MERTHATEPTLKRTLSALALAAAFAAIGCTAPSNSTTTGPTYRQRVKAKVESQAQARAYWRQHALMRQRERLEEWHAIRDRAARQIAEDERRKAARLELARRRWAAFQ